MKKWRIFWFSTVVVVFSITTIALVSNWPWYMSYGRIESYLLQRTPLGSSEEEVISNLRESGARLQIEEPWRGNVAPNTGFPPNTVAGSSYIVAVVGEYRVVFTTSVAAFYIFDSDRRLVEIAIRKTVDAL
jgi:hypothetical protein